MLDKLRQQHPKVWLIVGEYYMKMGKHTEARELMQRALKALPKSERELHNKIIIK
jgi:Tfp pilus assembly protein PilF